MKGIWQALNYIKEKILTKEGEINERVGLKSDKRRPKLLNSFTEYGKI